MSGSPPASPAPPPRRADAAPATLAPVAALAALAALTVIAALGTLATACSRPAPSEELLLPAGLGGDRSPESAAAVGVEFADPPGLVQFEVGGEQRPVVLTSAGGFRWRGRVPRGARLVAGVQPIPAAWNHLDRFAARVTLVAGRERAIVAQAAVAADEPRCWLALDADLGRWAGREVELEFEADLAPLPSEHRRSKLVGWGPVSVAGEGGARPAAGHPNVLMIVVDTLRADHLNPYGYRRDTSPAIAGLAAAGAVVETAYAQAPWTLPSAVSYLTGRYPGELLGPETAGFGIPAGVRSLPERMAELGYLTAGFVANPTMHTGNGFARGFDTFYTPPPVVESLRLPADAVAGRALSWLAAHQRRPFFLYVHFLDPHDPYTPPDLADGGRSPFFPGYQGSLTGDSVHGLYLGTVPLADPEADVAHLNALYDSEIRYVDRFVGELVAALRPEVMAETLVVLTSDHGEEMFDHGGWKHGETLYQEQLHVPLVVRWDGRVPAGSRLAGTVRLLDLVPTVLAAVDAPARESEAPLPGVDLMPALTGDGALPRRPALARHLAAGPLRAAVVDGSWKLILFNRDEPYRPIEPGQRHLGQLDLDRLARVELYDLDSDPGERVNLAASRPDRVEALEPLLVTALDRDLPGLRLLGDDIPPGAVLAAEIELSGEPTGWVPWFLGPHDRAELRGRRLTLELVGGPVTAGVRVLGEGLGIAGAALTLDGRPLPGPGLAVGADGRWSGQAVEGAALAAPAPPSAPGAALRAWIPAGRATPRAGETADEEARERLRALGYLR